MSKDPEVAEIDLLPKQTDAWELWEDPTTTEIGYGGAAGGGKTRLGWYLLIAICELFPGARCAVARKELKTLRLTSLAELFIIFMELGYQKDRDYTFNAQDNIIRFPNGSEIILLDTANSPQDPEYTRFGSLNLTAAWCEESNETPEKARDILNTRVGRHNKFVIDGKEVKAKALWLETFNPNKGHVYRNYYKPWKEGTLPPYRKFIRALPGDNSHLPSEYIEKLRNSPDKTIRERLLYGNFDYDDDPTRIMEYDAILDLRHNTLEDRGTDDTGTRIKPQRYLINDIARLGGDKIVSGLWEDMTLVGLEVNTYQDLDTTNKQIKDRAEDSKVPFSHILSDEDGVGGGTVDTLKGTKGFQGGTKPLEVYDHFTAKKISTNFRNLRSQCYFRLSEAVNRREMAIKLRYFKTNIEGYTMEKALSELEEELDAVKKVDNSGENTKYAIIPKRGERSMQEELGRSPDLADMLMMRMWYELKPAAKESQDAAARRSHRVVVRKAKANPAL